MKNIYQEFKIHIPKKRHYYRFYNKETETKPVSFSSLITPDLFDTLQGTAGFTPQRELCRR